LFQGENNTEFFHRVSNGRKRRNTIFSLEDGETHITGVDDLISHATSFYRGLFGPGEGNGFSLDSGLWDEGDIVTDEENGELIKPFFEEEIKKALFMMEKNKAVGLDGMPIEFYQCCWQIIKHDMIAVFEKFHKGGLEIRKINYDIITLLPKLKEANKIQ
jgi:hypothetical protein